MGQSKRSYAKSLARVISGDLIEAEQAIIRAVLSAPDGIKRAEVAKAAGYSISYTEGMCVRLRTAGLIETTNQGCNSRWCRPGDADRVAELVRAEILAHAQRSPESMRNYLTYERQRLRKINGVPRVARVDQDFGDERPVVRIVPAHLAQPIQLAGMRRSVFEVAA